MKLIIRVPNWVGDAVMALPAVDAARACADVDFVAVTARSVTAPLFQGRSGVDQVVVVGDNGPGLGGRWRAAGLIRGGRFAVGITLAPSLSSAFIFRLAGIPRRIGYAGDCRSWLLTEAVKRPRPVRHRVNEYLYLLEKISGSTIAVAAPSLVFSNDDNHRGESVLVAHGLAPVDRYIAIAPRAAAPSRRWGEDNYRRLATSLTSELQHHVVLIGTAADHCAGEEVRQANPLRVHNLCGQTDLIAAGAILAHAAVFIGNDSGLAHLADAAGCPVVVLSGADNPDETSPVSNRKRVIIKEIDCIRCVKNVCPKSGEAFMRCQKLITVDEVIHAATEIIRS